MQITLTGPEVGAPVWILLLGRPAFSFWTLTSSCVASIVYSKGLHGHDAPSMGLFTTYRILEVHQNSSRPPKDPYEEVPLSDRRPRGATRKLPGPDGLRTADTLRPGPIQYIAGTSSGAAADSIISENTTGHVLRAAAGKILSEHTAPSSRLAPVVRVRGSQTPRLTGTNEIPLTSWAWRALFEHRRHLFGHLEVPEAGDPSKNSPLESPAWYFWAPA